MRRGAAQRTPGWLLTGAPLRAQRTITPVNELEEGNRLGLDFGKLASVAVTDGKSLAVSGIKRKNRAVATLDQKQLAEHIGKRAQRGKLADVGFRPDRLGD